MPDTVQDLIRRAAAKHGVDEKLALAVAEQESGFNPTLTNKDSGATGTFQILPTTGTMLGVDPNDPRQNIDGGVKYLRQLMDRHQGDLDKVLRTYGGVKTSKGDFYSPEVQTRISKFRNLPPLADLAGAAGPVAVPTTTADVATSKAGKIGPASRGAFDIPVDQPERPSRPVSTAATGAQAIGPGRSATADVLNTGWQKAKRAVIETFDPRTPEGAINLLSTAGGLGGTALAARGTGAAATGAFGKKGLWSYVERNLLPAIGAGGGGAAGELYNQTRAGQPTDLAAAGKRGAEQAAYEFGGEAVTWPLRKAANWALAHPIAKYAKAGLEEATRAARDAAQAFRFGASVDNRNATAATSRYARTLKAGAADAATTGVQDARVAGTTGVQQAVSKKDADIVAARAAKATLIAEAKAQARAGLRAAKVAATKQVAGVAEEGAQAQGVAEAGATAAKGAATRATSPKAAAVARQAETRLTDIETQGLHDLAQAEDAWRTLETSVRPDPTATGEAVRAVVKGRPGVLPRAGEDKTPGPIAALLRRTGEQVREATRSYVEPVAATNVREEVTQRYLSTVPTYLREGAEGAADDLGEVVTDTAISPSAPSSTSRAPAAALPDGPHTRWQAAVDELDKAGAPDTAYRDILSTGSRATLKKGETWRGKVLEYIEGSKARAPAAATPAPATAAIPPAVLAQIQKEYPHITNPGHLAFIAERKALEAATIAADGSPMVTEQTLPGILRLISSMPDEVSFEDLHVVKTLLDATVNWEKSAKRPTEQIAKGARSLVRGALASVGHAPYEEATEAYQRLMDTQRQGLVKRVIAWVGKNGEPATVARALNPKNLQGATALHDLLVRQSAEGGDAAAGQAAWDSLASAYTHRTLLQGDPASLLTRLHTLERESPEFATLLFSGPGGLSVRGQLEQVGQITANAQANYIRTLQEAGIRGQANVTDTGAIIDRALQAMRHMTDEEIEAVRVAGNRQVAGAAAAGNADLSAAKAGGRAGVDAAKDERARLVAAARSAGKQTTRDATETAADAKLATAQSNAERTEAARQRGQTLTDAANANIREFAGSTIGDRWKAEAVTQEVADVARVFALFPNSFGLVAAARLLRGPHRADLLQYAAYSPKYLQTLTKMASSPVWDRGWGGAIRVFANEAYGPQAKKQEKAEPAPAVAAAPAAATP